MRAAPTATLISPTIRRLRTRNITTLGKQQTQAPRRRHITTSISLAKRRLVTRAQQLATTLLQLKSGLTPRHARHPNHAEYSPQSRAQS
jgi:hypothetical protein